MKIRCPHCQNPMEVVDEVSLDDLVCESCGSDFNLISDATTSYQTENRRVGQFELTERLGVGAFGAVWKARDTKLDRTVAIKLPRKEQLSQAESDQFVREARAAAQLRHPHIVGVHEVGWADDGSIFIVSDYISGLTLADWLTARRPTWRVAAELCVKVAQALDAAHQAGVIHRDLKPSNIMLDEQNEPHVMDFGLAKREAGEITMTADGQVLGTPAYMSPEQARGDAHRADRRADVYAMGVILFELLTGERPFRGNSRMLLHQVLHDEAPSPRSLNSTVPKDLETICSKCLEKDPNRRFATAAELATELERTLRGEPIQSRPVGAAERAWRWCKRRPAVASLSALFIASLLAGTGVSTYFAFDARQKAAAVIRAQKLAADNEQAARDSRIDANEARKSARNVEQIAASKVEQAEQRVGQVLQVMDVGKAPFVTAIQFEKLIDDYVNLSFATGGVAADLKQLHEGGATSVSFSKVLLLSIASVALQMEGGAAAADVVVLAEESGSMGVAHRYLGEFAPRLEEGLRRLGIGSAETPNRFGLVGFGGAPSGGHHLGHAHPLGPNGALMGNAREFLNAIQKLETSGAVEDGYDAIHFALTKYPWRPQAAHILILVTDEDRDIVDPVHTYDSILRQLREKRAVLHGLYSVIIDDGLGNQALALAPNGAAFLADGQGGFAVRKDGRLELDSLAGVALATRGNSPQQQLSQPLRHAAEAAGEAETAEAWRIYFRQGELRRDARLWQRALQDYNAAIELGGDAPELWVARAECHIQLKRWADADRDFSEALRRAPERGANWAARGASRMRLARWQDAANDFVKAIELGDADADLAEAWAQLSRCQQSWGAFDAERPLPPRWDDAPLEAPPLSGALTAAISAAHGIVHERFAVVQNMPLAALLRSADELRASHYRPLRIRPAAETPEPQVAACFTRDSLPWEVTRTGAAVLEAVVQRHRQDGWTPTDVALYHAVPTKAPPRESESAPARDAELQAIVVWTRPAEPPTDWRLWAGLPHKTYRARYTPLKSLHGFHPQTFHQFRHDGEILSSGIWVRTKRVSWKLTSEPFQGFLPRVMDSNPAVLADLHLQAIPPHTAAQRDEEALEGVRRDAEQNRSLHYQEQLGIALFERGRHSEAVEVFNAVLTQEARSASYGFRALAQQRLDARRGSADWLVMDQLNSDAAESLYVTAVFKGFKGDSSGLAELERQVNRSYRPSAARRLQSAAAHALASRFEKLDPTEREKFAEAALQQLEKALESGLAPAELLRDPRLDPLRERPEFQRLLAAHQPHLTFLAVSHSQPGYTAQPLVNLSLESHLEKMRQLAAAGYRPIAISAAHLPGVVDTPGAWRRSWSAGSVWRRPTGIPSSPE